MSNEIAVIYTETGVGDMTVDVRQPDGSVRESGVVMDDTGHLGLYLGDSATIAAGDILIVKIGGVIVPACSGGVYQPEAVIVPASQAGVDITFIKNVIEGDAIVDTSTNPWQIVIKIKGTGTELIRKDLKNVEGGNLTNANTIVGGQLE
jgi:hypothetical protein